MNIFLLVFLNITTSCYFNSSFLFYRVCWKQKHAIEHVLVAEALGNPGQIGSYVIVPKKEPLLTFTRFTHAQTLFFMIYT